MSQTNTKAPKELQSILNDITEVHHAIKSAMVNDDLQVDLTTAFSHNETAINALTAYLGKDGGQASKDPINPSHYQTDFGVQCIDIAQHLSYNMGNAFKYAWRAGQKDDFEQDIRKCLWYVQKAREQGTPEWVSQNSEIYDIFHDKVYGKMVNYPLQSDLLHAILYYSTTAETIIEQILKDNS